MFWLHFVTKINLGVNDLSGNVRERGIGVNNLSGNVREIGIGVNYLSGNVWQICIMHRSEWPV